MWPSYCVVIAKWQHSMWSSIGLVNTVGGDLIIITQWHNQVSSYMKCVEYSLCSVGGNIIFLGLDLKVLIEGLFFNLTY